MKKDEIDFKKLKGLMEDSFDKIEPHVTEEEMWEKIEKKRTMRTHLSPNGIPMYVSSLFAIAASLYFVLSIPSVSDRATNENEAKVAMMEEAIEDMQVATSFFGSSEEEISTSNELLTYPAYLPKGFQKESEEYHGDSLVIRYVHDGDQLVVYKNYGEDIVDVFQGEIFKYVIERDMGEYILEIRGNIAPKQLEKVADSMWQK